MRYTRHFSMAVNELGTPQLDVKQFKVFMNIVALESRIAAYEQVHKAFANTPHAHKMAVEINKIRQSLSHLTLNMSPEALLEELLELSQG
ncbi:MAG: hypothetical protein KDC69_03535 [Flavobacteriaceae bacterium]|nr:hypothetical protein [Flavobacteriaceae bacterium]